MIVTAVLDRVRDEDGKPIFLLKGVWRWSCACNYEHVPPATTTQHFERGLRRPSSASTRR